MLICECVFTQDSLKAFITHELSVTQKWNLHQLTSLTESQKALEAHGCKPWVTNISIVPHTLDILTSNTRITYCIIVSKGTGSLSAPNFNSTDNDQPWKKACCEIPTRVHPHLPGLTLNQYTTWLASIKSGALSDPVPFDTGVQRWLLATNRDCIAVGLSFESPSMRKNYCLILLQYINESQVNLFIVHGLV